MRTKNPMKLWVEPLKVVGSTDPAQPVSNAADSVSWRWGSGGHGQRDSTRGDRRLCCQPSISHVPKVSPEFPCASSHRQPGGEYIRHHHTDSDSDTCELQSQSDLLVTNLPQHHGREWQ